MVYLRGQNEEWTTITDTSKLETLDILQYNSIISASDAQFNIGGRLSSLFTGNEEETDKSIIMSAIFYNSACRDASKLVVPKNAKLSYAFEGCSSLIYAPRTLSDSCSHIGQYRNMFEDCISLTNAPELPATVLNRECYSWMFANCTSLTNAPELPATIMQPRCYERMFNGCTSLTSFNFGDQSVFAVSDNCFTRMFNGCSKLSYIRCLYDDRDGAGPLGYTDWTSGVAAQGTFVTNTNKWKTGPNGIPEGWSVVIE